ncbi:hypothetical protein [Lentzea sp. NPDC059081]|uniref:hypothetical protein n=1 Tax=Lentzea sp. NPDC059081 TaxID=3346719 RepID=UPI0036802A8F
MGRTAYVYVGEQSAENFGIGKDRGVWGWETSVLDKKDGHDVAGSLQPGDRLVLGHRAPGGPRVTEERWSQVRIEQVLVMEITRPLYASADEVWPDKEYRHRVDVRLLETQHQVGVDFLGHRGMDALRQSGCRQGTPVVFDDPDAADEPEPEDFSTVEVEGLGEEELFEGELDGVSVTTVRKEQRWLKSKAFGNAELVECELCGEMQPQRLIWAAHIKRRADCSEEERRRWRNNIIAACKLGCDDLFEHGYVYVGEDLRIQAGPPARGLESVLAFIEQRLAGRTVSDRGGARAPMFAAHRHRFL